MIKGGWKMSCSIFLRASAFALLLVPLLSWGADQKTQSKDAAPPSPGAQLYGQFCASCHDHSKDRIPAREVIAKRSPDEVMQALTNGLMRTQAAGLNMNDRIAVAT